MFGKPLNQNVWQPPKIALQAVLEVLRIWAAACLIGQSSDRYYEFKVSRKQPIPDYYVVYNRSFI